LEVLLKYFGYIVIFLLCGIVMFTGVGYIICMIIDDIQERKNKKKEGK